MTHERSSCDKCGTCCHYEIPLTILDIHRLARHFGLTDRQGFQQFVQDRLSWRTSLFVIRKESDDLACMFLGEDNTCTVHESKPNGCALYVCARNRQPSAPPDQKALWTQSVAKAVTMAYTRTHGAEWHEADFQKGLKSIESNTAIKEGQQLRLGRCDGGNPVGMVYDCSTCGQRGCAARETPVTIDDIDRMTGYLGITWEAFFREYVDTRPSEQTGGLRLKRDGHCTFFNGGNCAVRDVRPMHCRFTPCPKRPAAPEVTDSLFLGAGTVEEQFRHQVALAFTRRYVQRHGTACHRKTAASMLREVARLVKDREEMAAFRQQIAPYRYADDAGLVAHGT